MTYLNGAALHRLESTVQIDVVNAIAWRRVTNPVCVKVADDGDVEHVVAGSQGDNMERMAKMRRGGGRYLVRRGDSRGVRRERSVALREAVRHGWDAAAVEAALLGGQPTLW